jgi:hypothetical protein
MEELKIGKGFSLPLELVTSTQAILARKRSGKSYTASVQAEEMLSHGQQVIVIDPTSAWWGLRSSADGKESGFSIVVFGGDHADAPLDYRSGKAMAAAIVEHSFSAIFDVGNFHTEEQLHFVNDFCAELLRINRNALHLFVDEADTFAPQRTYSVLSNKCLGTVTRLVKQGGIRGVGFTMITQRSASINWDILSQVDILTILRMSAPHDVKPVFEWLQSETTKEFAISVKEELPRLPVGTAFFASAPLNLAQRVEVRKRKTFNSGATPKPGERKAEPKVMASIDIQKLGSDIAASVQKAKEDSPEYLKQRIADLENETAKGGKVDMGVLEDVQRMEAELAELRPIREKHQNLYTGMMLVGAELAKVSTAFTQLRDRFNDTVGYNDTSVEMKMEEWKPVQTVEPSIATRRELSSAPSPSISGGQAMAKAERSILSVLAQHGRCSKAKTAAIAGYSMNGGGFNNSLSSCRTKGWLSGSDLLEITADGRSALGTVQKLQRGGALLQMWVGRLSKAEGLILQALASGKTVDKDKLGEMTGYAASGGGFNNALSSLRTLGLIEGSRTLSITRDFAEAIQ